MGDIMGIAYYLLGLMAGGMLFEIVRAVVWGFVFLLFARRFWKTKDNA